MKAIPDMIDDAKKSLPNVTPAPDRLTAESSAHDLKSRLEWGQPALTILDVRDRESFNDIHIMGAMTMPLDEVVNRASSSIDRIRDIYVYGGSDEEAAQAAAGLREAGFQNVAQLKGGLEAWKAVAGPMEGTEEEVKPGNDAYNVVARVSQHLENQKKDV
ncbi:MAG: rhodanese-like domain-containing protein [Scytonematopsis contorta HA4267-MV1]|jgi:rhodanese-related sulfurtransferase|nr:rhodanese-like domain-containing protein [Scytonematopsis contorta HA4267-MV1]